MAKRSEPEDRPSNRNGNLRIPLPFEEAVKAATETKAPPQPPKKPRQKKRAKS